MTFPTLRARTQRAFTLVEVMVVVVIIGILSGLAVPKFIQITGENQLDGDALSIMADMNWAKAAAIKAGYPYYVEFKDTLIGEQSRSRWIIFDSITKTTKRIGITGVSVKIALPEGIEKNTTASFAGFSSSVSSGFQDGLAIDETVSPCYDGAATTIESWASKVKMCGGATGNMATGALYLTSTRSDSRAYAIQYNRKKSLAIRLHKFIGGAWEAK